jgi:hypothetical protein
MLTFIVNHYCPEAYHRPDHSIFVVEYHTKIIIIETRTQELLGVYDLSSCNLLAKTNNFVLCAVLSFLVSELQEPPSAGLEYRAGSHGPGLCCCNLLFETSNCGLGAVLLSSLFSELQEPPSPRIELRTLLRSFNSCILFLVSRNKHAKFCANRCIPSRAISEHIYKHIHSHNFNFIFKIIYSGLM